MFSIDWQTNQSNVHMAYSQALKNSAVKPFQTTQRLMTMTFILKIAIFMSPAWKLRGGGI